MEIKVLAKTSHWKTIEEEMPPLDIEILVHVKSGKYEQKAVGLIRSLSEKTIFLENGQYMNTSWELHNIIKWMLIPKMETNDEY